MRVEVKGVGLHVEVEGAGRPVVLLHGFPDRGRLWRHQVAALVDAGYRTIVPDLRGFGDSDRGLPMEASALHRLVGDVTAVLDQLGVERAHVVGHDWGATVAWSTAAYQPARVDHLVALSVAHPTTFTRPTIAALEKSWYMLLFQFEDVAERFLSADGWGRLREWTAHPDIETVIADLSRPGALTSALNIYRSNIRPSAFVDPAPTVPPITVPTMGVWSSGDRFLMEAPMQQSRDYVTAPFRYERVDGAGHWMQLDAPDAVSRLLVDFLPR